MKQALIYTRVSTEEQAKGYSLQTQLERCHEYATLHGYSVIAAKEDRHSGEDLDRPGLNEILELVSKAKIDVLLVFDTDRLSRGGPAHHAIIEMQLEKHGTRIEYVIGDYNDNSPESELSRMIKQSISWYENKQRRERITRGKNAKVRAGKVITGARPAYGYDYSNGALIINPEESEVVKRIFQWIKEGESSRNIARKLHEQGVPTRADKVTAIAKSNGYSVWNPSSVKKILSNPTYTGTWHFNKTKKIKVNGKPKQVQRSKSEWLAVAVPQIIDESTFNQTQKLLSDNQARSKRNTQRSYLLQGMIYCSCGLCCNSSYRREVLYYRCAVKAGNPWVRTCKTRFHIRADVLEALVWSTVIDLLLNPDYLKMEVEKQRQKTDEELAGRRGQLEAIQKAIADTERKIGILLDQMLDGDFPKSVIDDRKKLLTQNLKQLEAEKSQIEVDLSSAVITPLQEELLNQLANTIKSGIDNVDFEKMRKILHVLRIRIDVCDKKKVRLSGILPMDSEPIDIDSFTATSLTDCAHLRTLLPRLFLLARAP